MKQLLENLKRTMARAVGIKEPETPGGRRILFVCMGNICRSPMGERLLLVALGKHGKLVYSHSAGTGDWHVGESMNPMAAKPRILLYDEPTTGLDPITSITVDQEIVKLRDLESVSSILVTHQLRDAFYVAEHTAVRNGRDISIEKASPHKCDEAEFIMLREGRIAFEGNAGELRAAAAQDRYIAAFLS